MDLSEYLRHTGQIAFQQKANAYKDTATTSIVTTACYCYYDTERRIVNGSSQLIMLGWTVLLPSTLSSVQPGDLIQRIVDINDQPVLDSARITDIIVYRHFVEGDQFRQAILKLN